MSTEAILNLVFSIVTASIAVAAVLISVVQIRKSNKQALFDRRLKAYLTVKWMQSLCSEHQSLAKTYIKEAETDKEWFVHVSGLVDKIADNDNVEFEIDPNGKKGPCAVNVKKVTE